MEQSSGVIIREASKADASVIAHMSRRTFYDTFALSNTKADMDKFMNEQFTYEQLVEEVGAAGNIFLLAQTPDEILGYARLRLNNNPPSLGVVNALEIARLYVEKKAIGRGVGNALMAAGIAQARHLGCSCVWLGVWEHNERAIRFYQYHEFVKFDEHPFLLGNDRQTDWLMKKTL